MHKADSKRLSEAIAALSTTAPESQNRGSLTSEMSFHSARSS